ncbi:MAG: glycosyltransferase family 1 protein [Chloroflexota bacterium]
MRIGIDATPLPPNPLGAGTYIIQLTRALTELHTDEQWVIFAQRSGRAKIETPAMTNVEWVLIPDISPSSRLVWEQSRLPFLARRSRIDILHSLHYTRPWVLPYASSIVTFHDMTFLLYPELHTLAKRILFPLAIQMSARRAQAIITVSEHTRKDTLRLLNLPEERVITTSLAASPDYRPISDALLLENCKRKYNLPDSFILYVGPVEPRKNLPLLLKAYHRLAVDGLNASLVIVGALGWMYAEVMQQVNALNLSSKVHFLGYIPAEDLPMVYNLARVFVYPSLYEGFGLPPLEAMACGTPVITSAVSAMIETVGEAGILVNPQGAEGLVDAIRVVCEDDELHQQLSQKGRAQAAKFTWKHTAQETLRVYQKVWNARQRL